MKKIIVLLLGCILALSVSYTAAATVFYVSKDTGIDAPWPSRGTSLAPWATMAYAIAQANGVAGKPHVIKVAKSTTNYTQAISVPTLISIEGGYEYTGWTRDIQQFKTQLQFLAGPVVQLGAGSYISGMFVTGAGTQPCINIDMVSADVMDNTLSGCSVGVAVRGTTTASTHHIMRNTMDNNHTGIRVNLGNLHDEIAANKISHSTNAGILTIGLNTGSTISIHNNLLLSGGAGIKMLTATATYTVAVINNTITGNTYGLYLDCPQALIVNRNNIIFGNSTTDADNLSSPSLSTSYCDIGTVAGSGFTGIGNIAAPVRYIFPPLNYRFRSGSRGINEGDPSPLYNDPDLSRNDMGAYGGPGASQWPAAQLDSDFDGLSDAEENSLGLDGYITDPYNPDTDGDMLRDGDEYLKHTNPLVKDTDGGGLWDGVEYYLCNSDPTVFSDDAACISIQGFVDLDQDGLNDSIDLDPFDMDLDDDGLPDGADYYWDGAHADNQFDHDGGGQGDGSEMLVDFLDRNYPGDDAFPSTPPQPGANYLFDLDGDHSITKIDRILLNEFLGGSDLAFNQVSPATINLMDLSGNGNVYDGDTTILRMFLTGSTTPPAGIPQYVTFVTSGTTLIPGGTSQRIEFTVTDADGTPRPGVGLIFERRGTTGGIGRDQIQLIGTYPAAGFTDPDTGSGYTVGTVFKVTDESGKATFRLKALSSAPNGTISVRGRMPGTPDTLERLMHQVAGTDIVFNVQAAPPTLTSIDVTPNSPSIDEGQSMQLSAICWWSDSNTTNCTNEVTWSATGNGTITAGGLFTAGSIEGCANNEALIYADWQGKQGSEVVVIRYINELSSLDTSPASGSINEGSTLRFTATCTWQCIDPTDCTTSVQWGATGLGTITSAGLFTAGAAGCADSTATVTAQYQTRSDTSSVSVKFVNSFIGITDIKPDTPVVDESATLQLHAYCSYECSAQQECTEIADWSTAQPHTVGNSAGNKGLFTAGQVTSDTDVSVQAVIDLVSVSETIHVHNLVTDTDHDGVEDSVEDASGCMNKNNPDTDGDGLCDGSLTVPGVCVAGEDKNNNGVVEQGLGETNPCDSDSDHDGLSDKVETNTGIFNGPADTGSNPWVTDTDSGGESDYAEVMKGHDPNNADDDCTSSIPNPALTDTRLDTAPAGSPAQFPAVDASTFAEKLIVWQDGRNPWHIYARLLIGNTLDSGDTLIDTGSLAKFPDVDYNGSFLVVWQDERAGKQVYARSFSHDTGLGVEFRVDEGSHVISDPQVTSTSSTKFNVTWIQDGTSLMHGVVTGGGVSTSAVSILNGSSLRSHKTFGVGNNFWLVYDQGGNIYLEELNALGEQLVAPVRLNSVGGTGTAAHPSLACYESGKCLVAWEDTRRSGNKDIRANIYDGHTVNNDFRLDFSAIQGKQSKSPDVTLGKAGSFIVVWADDRLGNWDIFTNQVEGNGILGCEYQIDRGGIANSSAPSVVSSDRGLLTVWSDDRSGDTDIYINRYSGPVEKISLIAPTGNINPGQDFSVNLKISTGTMTLGHFGLIINYDPNLLQLHDSSVNPAIIPEDSRFSIRSWQLDPDEVQIVGDNVQAGCTTVGEIWPVRITFKLLENAPMGIVIPINILPNYFEGASGHLQVLNCSQVDNTQSYEILGAQVQTFTPCSTRLGADQFLDCNGDGTIDISDVLTAESLINQEVFNTQGSCFTNMLGLQCDVNGNGYIDENDVAFLRMFIRPNFIFSGDDGVCQTSAAGGSDDIQVTPAGRGEPDGVCIIAGGTDLVTEPQSDDAVSGNKILSGPNGVCNTTATPPDVQYLPVGYGKFGSTCIDAGPDGVLQSTVSGDDYNLDMSAKTDELFDFIKVRGAPATIVRIKPGYDPYYYPLDVTQIQITVSIRDENSKARPGIAPRFEVVSGDAIFQNTWGQVMQGFPSDSGLMPGQRPKGEITATVIPGSAPSQIRVSIPDYAARGVKNVAPLLINLVPVPQQPQPDYICLTAFGNSMFLGDASTVDIMLKAGGPAGMGIIGKADNLQVFSNRNYQNGSNIGIRGGSLGQYSMGEMIFRDDFEYANNLGMIMAAGWTVSNPVPPYFSITQAGLTVGFFSGSKSVKAASPMQGGLMNPLSMTKTLSLKKSGMRYINPLLGVHAVGGPMFGGQMSIAVAPWLPIPNYPHHENYMEFMMYNIVPGFVPENAKPPQDPVPLWATVGDSDTVYIQLRFYPMGGFLDVRVDDLYLLGVREVFGENFNNRPINMYPLSFNPPGYQGASPAVIVTGDTNNKYLMLSRNTAGPLDTYILEKRVDLAGLNGLYLNFRVKNGGLFSGTAFEPGQTFTVEVNDAQGQGRWTEIWRYDNPSSDWAFVSLPLSDDSRFQPVGGDTVMNGSTVVYSGAGDEFRIRWVARMDKPGNDATDPDAVYIDDVQIVAVSGPEDKFSDIVDQGNGIYATRVKSFNPTPSGTSSQPTPLFATYKDQDTGLYLESMWFCPPPALAFNTRKVSYYEVVPQVFSVPACQKEKFSVVGIYTDTPTTLQDLTSLFRFVVDGSATITEDGWLTADCFRATDSLDIFVNAVPKIPSILDPGGSGGGQPTGYISGKVFSNAYPYPGISGVKVHAGDAGKFSATTISDGSYSFQDVPVASNYTMEVMKKNKTGQNASNIEVDENQTTTKNWYQASGSDTDGDSTNDSSDTDDDNDNLPDSSETTSVSSGCSGNTPSATDPDSDNDGYLDGVDAFPCDASEWLDTDGDNIGDNADTDDDNDNIADTEEVILGTDGYITDPKNPDTDGDGLNDGFEVNTSHTNPTLADSDSDGMPDAWEWTYHSCVNPTTADASADPDSDGFTNLQEYQNSTDPCVASSTACSDSIDNDADGKTDYPTDPDCTSSSGTAELKPTRTGVYDTTGTAYNSYVKGNYAYVADGTSGMHIINISTPSSPSRTSTYNTGDDAQDVFVRGNYAYVANYQAGLMIINVSSPSSPSRVGSYNTPGYSLGVFVSGKYAYVADREAGLKIIDVSSPSSPTQVGSYTTTDWARSVWVSGNYAYVAAKTAGLQILNVSTPSSITRTGYYDTPDDAYAVFLKGNYAYVADDDTGLLIINVSTPSSPTLTGSYDTAGQARDVWVIGNYAYVADNNSGLEIINVNTASSPKLAGAYDTTGTANGVYVAGKYAYVSDGTAGLQIINTNGTDNDSDGLPNFWERYYNSCMLENTADSTGNYDSDGVTNQNEYLYSTNPCSSDTDGDAMPDGWEIDNNLNPLTNDASGDCDGDGLTNLQEYQNSTNPFASDSDSDGLDDNLEVNTSHTNPNSADSDSDGMPDSWEWTYHSCVNPTSADASANPDGDALTNLQEYQNGTDPCHSTVCSDGIDNDADGKTDTVDPDCSSYNDTAELKPTRTGVYDTTGTAYNLFVTGNYAYVADGTAGLQIINVSTPSSPSKVATYDTPDEADDVVVRGNYAYLADRQTGLMIFNVSTPSSPSLVATYNTPGYAWGVFLSGKYAYVADREGGLKIINVANPASPAQVGQYITTDYARSVWVNGNYAYVAAKTAGLVIINVSNPASPSLTGTYNTPDDAYAVFVRSNYAFVADNNTGLMIINVTTPSSPTLTATFDTTDQARDVWVIGNYAYVADNGAGLEVVNINTIASPTLAGSYDTTGSATGVHVRGKYAYLADGSSGLEIINTSGTDNDSDNLPNFWERYYNSCMLENTADSSANYDSDGADNQTEYLNSTSPCTADTDGDAIPDGWEITNGTNPLINDASGDCDDDGLTNLQEYQHSTNPLNPDSDGDGLSDGYEVNTSGTNPNLTDTDGDNLSDYVEEITKPCLNPNSADTDGDGLQDGGASGEDKDNDSVLDAGETDPCLADTDGDNLSDYVEVVTKPCLNPRSTDTDGDGLQDGGASGEDKDNDGVLDAGETDPCDSDTDDDSLSDGYEVNTSNTNPRLADTDGDGLSDGYEVNTSHTNPNATDTDGDGSSDYVEVNNGCMNPLVAQWDADGDALPDAWELNHSFNACSSSDGAADADSDKISNANEYWNRSRISTADPTGYGAPGDSRSFWGDSGAGDGVIGPEDLSIMRSLVAGDFSNMATLKFYNVIPTSGQTMDLDPDGVFTATDLSILRDMIAGRNCGYVGSLPTALELSNPPASTVQVGSTTHIGVKVKGQTSGRYMTGGSVVFKIDTAASKGSATIFGGDGPATDHPDYGKYRWDQSGKTSSGATDVDPARVMLRMDAAGTVVIKVYTPQVGVSGQGRYMPALTLSDVQVMGTTP